MDRRRNLWPLPGGADSYAANLQALLQAVGSSSTRSALEDYIAQSAPNVRSTSTVRGYVAVPVTLGFLERGSGRTLVLTNTGRRYARTGDLSLLREALIDRVFGVQELLDELTVGPSTCPALTGRLAGRGIAWNHPMAVRYRVWWLVASGAIDSTRDARVDRLTLTPVGRRLLAGRVVSK